MINVKKAKKPLIIILSVILGIIFIFAAFLGIYYLSADALIYHYVDLSAEVTYYAPCYDKVGETVGKGIKYPFFGNPFTISEERGTNIGFPLGAGERYLDVYTAINDPICGWVEYMRLRYKNNVVADYTVEMDNEYITVNFSGTLTENDEVIPIEQKFVLSIANVTADTLPTWENSDEISEGYSEYLFYCFNWDTAEPPGWLLEWRQRAERIQHPI